MTTPPPYDLGPEFNRASAWYRWPLPEDHPCVDLYEPGWMATVHGAGGDEKALRRCGCGPCRAAADSWAELLKMAGRPPPPPPEPEPPKVVDVAPVAAHVRRLLADGMSRSEIAVAARLDRTTVGRVLRPDVRRVAAVTAEALLAVRNGHRLRAVG